MYDPDMPEYIKQAINSGELMFSFVVDDDGIMKDGEDSDHTWSDEFVAMGYGKNIQCVLRYPDGRMGFGNRASVTPSGIEFLKRELAPFASELADDLDDGLAF